MLRSWLLIFTMVVFTMTTEPDAIFSSLTSFGVPSVLISIVLLMWRYLSLFVDLAHSMADARALRSISAKKSIRCKLSQIVLDIQYTGAMVGSMFVRAYERSERIYQAMLLRGFDGSVRTLHSSSLRVSDITQILLVLLVGFCFIIGAYGIKA
jgi:cobalt/nickel transport system permease protein